MVGQVGETHAHPIEIFTTQGREEDLLNMGLMALSGGNQCSFTRTSKDDMDLALVLGAADLLNPAVLFEPTHRSAQP